MRHLFIKYLTSTLLIAAFFCLCFGLTEAGAGGFGLFQTRDSATLQASKRDTMGEDLLRPSSRLQSIKGDTTTKEEESKPRRSKGKMFDDIVEGKATDSVVFDARNKMIYSYREGDVTYQGMNLKADFMRVNMQTKDIYAHGIPSDTVDGKPTTTHPEFSDGGTPYSMDTITYNLGSKNAYYKY